MRILWIVFIFPLALVANETKSSVKVDDVIDVKVMEEEATTSPSIAPAGETSASTSTEPSLNAQAGVEKIQVTGSHIKRIDVEGPSPVIVLSREDLDRSGYNSVSDVLRDSALSSFGAKREATEEVSSIGSSTMGLRGFGADKVLVLMDGQRLPKIGGGSSVDLNLIPFQAVERIEILKDGASATYGSDALAGVINFITKKDFDGSVINLRYSLPEEKGGNRSDISATYGKNFAKGNILAVYQYRSNRRIWDRDRLWSDGRRNPNGWSSYSSPANYRPKLKGAGYKAAASCPPERLDANGICRFDYTQYTSSLPDLEQHSAMLTGNYEVAGDVDAYANLNYTRRLVHWQFAPSADDFKDNTLVGGKNYAVKKSTAQKLGLNTQDDIELRYRTVNELGARARRDTTNAYGATTGVRGFLSDTWEWDASANHGFSELYNLGHAGYGNTKALFGLLQQEKLNPFDASPTGDFSSARHQGEQWVRSNTTNVQLLTSGELGQALGGQWSMAVGAASNWEAYQVEVDSVTGQGDLWGGTGESGQGSRNFQSVFSELALNYRSLELQLAGRFDNYSDFGSTINPKFAIRYKPIRALMFRGSVGTGFKAPSLDQLYSSASYAYPWFADTQYCTEQNSASCPEEQHRVYSGGNRNLKEETSFSYNLGTVVQPTKNFGISIDYWGTRIENAVGLDLADLMFAESVLGNAGVQAHGVRINRTNGDKGQIADVFAPNLNLAKQESEGIDLSASYLIRAGRWTFRPQMDHYYLIKNVEEVFPGLGFRNKLDEWGRPRWRNTVFLTTGLYNHSVRIGARTIAGQYKIAHLVDPSNKGRLPTYTEYDLHYEFAGGWGGTLALGAKNVFGSDRPTDRRASFDKRLNTALYDQVGRLYYLGYSQTF